MSCNHSQIGRGIPLLNSNLAGSRSAIRFAVATSRKNFSRVIKRSGDVSFPGMLIKRILCGEDAILNNVDQSEARLGRLGGVAGADEGRRVQRTTTTRPYTNCPYIMLHCKPEATPVCPANHLLRRSPLSFFFGQTSNL